MKKMAGVVVLVGALSVAACSSSGSSGGSEEPNARRASDGSTSTSSSSSSSSSTGSTRRSPGGATGGGESADEVAVEWFQATGDGAFDRVWDLVLPAQQELVTEDAFIECAEVDAGNLQVDEVEVKRTSPELYTVPVLDETLDGEAVTITVKGSSGRTPFDESVVVHVVQSEGRWYMTMDENRVTDARKGC